MEGITPDNKHPKEKHTVIDTVPEKRIRFMHYVLIVPIVIFALWFLYAIITAL